jgi:hypothetical protein
MRSIPSSNGLLSVFLGSVAVEDSLPGQALSAKLAIIVSGDIFSGATNATRNLGRAKASKEQF